MNSELEKLLSQSQNAWKAMEANEADGAMFRWQSKPVLENILLSSMETAENLNFTGPGNMSVSDEQSLYGTTSVKVVIPNVFGPVPESHRSYAYAKFDFDAGGADWRHYNRISFWVYPDCPGYHNVWLGITLNNGGEVKYPREKYFEGTHHVNVPNGRWTRVVWEMPYTYRDRVTHITIGHHVHGRQAGMAEISTLYFNKLELSVVEADHYEGWELTGRIAFCHSGYRPGDRKLAITSNSGEESFSVCDAESGEAVFTGPVKTAVHDIGCFDEMDFTALVTPGKYIIKLGNMTTKPFYIDSYPYESAVWKTVNFFMQERCGTDIPGIHLPCHMDCYSVHPDGRRVSVGGGWHDAGDLSQGQCNTSESAHAMLDMAQRVEKTHPELALRLLEEARWGLNWLLRTRFGDGYRCVWTTIGLWTENIEGDADDIVQPARNDPFENLCGCGAEAAAARLFGKSDAVFAGYCLKAAREDFDFALEKLGEKFDGCQINGQAGVAAMELYRATGEEYYLDKAIGFADAVLACQQQDMPDWDVPVRGFFYGDSSHSSPIAYAHRAHEQAPVMTLSLLCRWAPAEKQNPRWKDGLGLYAEYIKTIVKYIEPYGLLPGAIYRVGDLDSPDEQARDYAEQVLQGVRLSPEFYLRRFPVAFQFRGFMGVLMTKAKAAASAALALGDSDLLEIARKQLEWILGCNPFARSYMYGEGYDFTPQYSEFANDIVGEVPVGIQTFENRDLPFMPMMNSATYYEIWVHTASRMLWTMADLF